VAHPSLQADVNEADPITQQPDRAQRIIADVCSWPDVEVGPHRFGGLEFRVGRREVGHLHGGRIADLPFPRRTRDELIAAGRALPHHVLPDSGWVTFRIKAEADVEAAVELFRLSYERAVNARSTGAAKGRPGPRPARLEPHSAACPCPNDVMEIRWSKRDGDILAGGGHRGRAPG
jgi:Family of unknown function (DUF5519)